MAVGAENPEDTPLVSVVIPVYNGEAHLGEAIDSVLGQTYRHFEIIVVDDGSTDGTPRILSEYGAKIRTLVQCHRGAAAARNLGIREAKGEVVAFLDADDLWYPSKLEKQIALFESCTDLAMVFTGHDLLLPTGPQDSTRGRDKRIRLMNGNLVRNIFMSSGVATPTVAVRRRIFGIVGMFDDALELAEDDNLWMRIAAGHRVDLIDEPLATIRIHKASITRNQPSPLTAMEHHIRLIRERYPTVWAELCDLVPEKLASYHFRLGRQQLASGQHDLARQSFATGLYYRPWALEYRLYWLISLVPERALGPLRRIRGRVSGKA